MIEMNTIGNLFVTGIVFGSGPCLASCGPLLVTYLAGSRENVPQSILSYLMFSFSRLCAYIIITFVAFFIGQAVLKKYSAEFALYSAIIAGGVVIFLGANMVFKGANGVSFSQRLCCKQACRNQRSRITLAGFFIGLMPCMPLIAIFSYISLIARHWAESVAYAVAFGVGTVFSPLLVICGLTGIIARILPQEKYVRGLSIACGLILVVLGLQIIFRAR
jgi:sulfite exporter TauE/SafE